MPDSLALKIALAATEKRPYSESRISTSNILSLKFVIVNLLATDFFFKF